MYCKISFTLINIFSHFHDTSCDINENMKFFFIRIQWLSWKYCPIFFNSNLCFLFFQNSCYYLLIWRWQWTLLQKSHCFLCLVECMNKFILKCIIFALFFFKKIYRGKKLSYLFKISKLISQCITVNLYIFNYEMIKNIIYILIFTLHFLFIFLF